MSKSKAKFILFIILTITVLFASQINKIKFNYDFDMFFPDGDENFDYYNEFMEQFGSDNDFLLVALPTSDFSDSTFLSKVDAAVANISTWQEVEYAQSLTNSFRYQITPLGINKIRMFNSKWELDSTKVLTDEDLIAQFIADDKKSVAITVKHEIFKLKGAADNFYLKIKTELESQFEEVIISGKIEAQYHFVKKLERELVLLLSLSISLVAIALYMIFRTTKGVALPFFVLILTTIWNVGLMGLVGKDMDVMMIMVPPILLVVAMSDVIHFCSKYNELKATGCDTVNAIRQTLKSVGMATLLTSISTAVGFATLTISAIAPLRDFGLFTAIGVLIAFVVTFALLPCLLTLFEQPLNKDIKSELRWAGYMRSLFCFVLKQKKSILILAPIITLLLASGLLSLRQNTFIVVGLKKSDPLLENIRFFDKHYGGSKTFEMTLMLNDQELFSKSTMRELEKISSYLSNQYGLNHLFSPIVLIKALNQGLHGGQSGYYKLPDNERDINRIRRLYLSRSFENIRSQLQTKEGNLIRISARSQDIGSYEARRKYAGLEEFIAAEIDPQISYRLTGTSFLVDSTDNHVVNNLLKGLAIGLLIISFLLMMLFRNLRLTLISLIPNFLPLIILAGILGFLSIDLNITTMLIFGIAFGIAVDDSIHFLSRFQQERRLGKTDIYAIKRTFISTGKSIVLTTIILTAGFGLFVFSGFSATYYTGVFVGFTLIVALTADLLVLPLLLLGKKKRKPSKVHLGSQPRQDFSTSYSQTTSSDRT